MDQPGRDKPPRPRGADPLGPRARKRGGGGHYLTNLLFSFLSQSSHFVGLPVPTGVAKSPRSYVCLAYTLS